MSEIIRLEEEIHIMTIMEADQYFNDPVERQKNDNSRNVSGGSTA